MRLDQLEKKHGPISVVEPKPTKPEPAEEKAVRRINWALAFATYQSGADLEDVARICDIPLNVVMRTAEEQEWAKLRTVATVNPGLPDATKEKLKAIEAHRAEQFATARRLARDLNKIIDDLLAGNLVKVKVIQSKGFVQKVEVPLDIQDRVALVNYANGVASMGYKALGDNVEHAAKDGGAAQVAASNQPAITIILPDVIAKPRELRSARPAIDV